MVDEVIDAPDQVAAATPPPVPDELPVKTQDRVLSTKGDSLAPSQGDAFARVLDPSNYATALAERATLTKQEIEEREARTGRELASARQYDERQERLLNAMGATMDDIKPWNAQEQMQKYSHNLWEDFASPGFIIGMLASQFTGMPMTSALNAGAAAINAINEGDNIAYHKAYDAWKENSNLALKRMQFEQDAFNDIDHLRKNRMDEWHIAAEAAAARFNDSRMLALLRAGMDPEAIKIVGEMSTLRKNMSDATDAIETNEIKRQFVMAHLTDENGKPTSMAAAIRTDPRKVANLRAAADEIFNTPKTIDQQIYHQLVTSDDYLNASSADQQKMMYDALKKAQDLKVRENFVQSQIVSRQAAWHVAHPNESPEEAQAADDRIASDLTLAYAPDKAAKIAIDKDKLEETKRKNDMVNDIAVGKLDVSRAAESEKETHNRNVETIQNSKINVQQKLADEKIRHDQAEEVIQSQRLNPFATEIKAAETEWESVRGAPVTDAMDAAIKGAYNTKGNAAAPRIAQVQSALAKIRQLKEDGEEPDDHKQETILREAVQRPITMGTEPISKEELASLGWPDDSLDLAANVYRKMGKLPGNLGTRQYAGKINGAIIQRAGELETAEGRDPGNMPQRWALFQAQRVGMTRYLAGGPQSSIARSLNVVVAHLDTIDELADALHNHDITRFNQLKNILSSETGGKAVPDFQAAKQIVGTEIVKALGVAGGGAQGERYEAAKTFDENRNPEVIKSVTETLRGMLVPQLAALRAQFTPATSLPIEMFDSELLPRTQKALRVHESADQTKEEIVTYKGKRYKRGPGGQPIPVDQ